MTFTVTLLPLALVLAVLALALGLAARQRRAGAGAGVARVATAEVARVAEAEIARVATAEVGVEGAGFERVGETVTVLGADGHAYDARLTGRREGAAGARPWARELVAGAAPDAGAQDWDAVDEVMGIPTRRRFLALVRRELIRASRYGRPLGLLALRVDRCEDLVGSHGPEVADAVLRAVAATVVADLRAADSLGRLGDDAFGVCLPEADAARTAEVAGRLVEEVGQIAVPAGGAAVGVTVSVAACSVAPDDVHDIDRLLAAADAALALAGAAGGNRVEAGRLDAVDPAPPRRAGATEGVAVAERGAV